MRPRCCRLAERTKIVLLAHEGRSNEQIAEQLDTRTARVSKWCRRFRKDRIAGLADEARPGKPAHYDKTPRSGVLSLLDKRPPKGYSQWNGNRLAEVPELYARLQRAREELPKH